ncbi:MAG: iron ABC transporter permease [Armatimonadota bacterium]|nr:iron ABC transporter permease [Armatimonadota bacterium]
MISTALGFLFALLVERSRWSVHRLLGPLSILPIITPPFVLGLAMIYMFGQRGFITHRLLGISTNVFFGPVGVATAQVLAFAPIAYLVLRGAVRAMDVAVEEAAETLGASREQIFKMVVWPLARPAIANAFLLVAIESLADFGNPLIVGGGQRYLATEIFYAIVGRFNLNEAAVYGVTLLAMTLTIFLIQRYWIGERGYVTVTGRPSAGAARPLPIVLDYGGTVAIVAWIFLTLLLYGSVFIGSVTKLWGFDYTPTLEHLRALSPQGWQVFWTSTRLAAVAAVPSALLGFLIGYLVTRVDFPGRSVLEFASMLSFAVPGTVMGIGYVLVFNQGVLLLTGTELIIILAFVFRNMPVAIRAGIAAIHQLDRSVEEAATLLGADTATTLRRVVGPLLRPALLSGLIFAFVNAMTAVSQVIFLVSPQHNLATVQILSHAEYGRLGPAAALASLLIVCMAAVVLAVYLATNRLGVGPGGEVAI